MRDSKAPRRRTKLGFDFEYAKHPEYQARLIAVRDLMRFEQAMASMQKEIDTLRAFLPANRTRPTIICLCGSTKFIETFAVQTWELELQGYIVLGCTLLPSWYCPVRDHFAEQQGVKAQRDAHHLQKIDLADEILVLNVGGYIGASTQAEIAYATEHGKIVRYLEAIR